MIVIQVRHNVTGRKAEVPTRSPQQAVRVLRMLHRLNGPWTAYGDYFRRR